jgi:hypothetical protein
VGSGVRQGPLDQEAAVRTWDTVTDDLLDLAHLDLRAGGYVRATLVAARGPRLLFHVRVRPFAPGRIAAALIETLSLAALLGADRLALMAGGGTASVPAPAHPDVVALTIADAHGAPGPPPVATQRFAIEGGTLVPRVDAAGPCPPAGTVDTLLAGGAWAHRELTGTGQDIAEQWERCERLGHVVVAHTDLLATLAVTP